MWRYHNLRRSVLSVRLPVPSGIALRVYGHVSQTCCPFNIKFAQELTEPAFAAREALAGRDARSFAREILGMTQAEFSAVFEGSPMKRAKLRGLKRNAAVVLGNVGTPEDAALLVCMLAEEPDEMVREHAAWALARLRGRRSRSQAK